MCFSHQKVCIENKGTLFKVELFRSHVLTVMILLFFLSWMEGQEVGRDAYLLAMDVVPHQLFDTEVYHN